MTDYAKRAAERLAAGEDLSLFEEAAMQGDSRFRREVETRAQEIRGELRGKIDRMVEDSKEMESTQLPAVSWNYNGRRRLASVYRVAGTETCEIREYPDDLDPVFGTHSVIFKESKSNWRKADYFKILEQYGYEKSDD